MLKKKDKVLIMTKFENKFVPLVSRTYEVVYMEQQIQQGQIKQSKLSVASRVKVVNRNSSYQSWQADSNISVVKGYGPVLDGGGYSSSHCRQSEKYAICANSSCGRMILRSRTYCSEHGQTSTKMSSLAMKEVDSAVKASREVAKKHGGHVIETELKEGEMRVHYFPKRERKPEPKIPVFGRGLWL